MDVRTGSSVDFVDDLERWSDAVAIVQGDRTCTYQQLSAAVDAAVAALPDRRRLVAIRSANDVGAIVWYLAALRARHTVLLLPASDALATEALVGAWEPAVVVGPTATGWEPVERPGAPDHDLHPDLALLLSTSGSTGAPKLVRLSWENLQANAAAIVTSLGIGAGDRAVTTLPLHYCYGLSVVHSHLAAGAGLVMTELSVVDPCFWELVRVTGATGFAGVPHTFDLLERVGFDAVSPTLPSLRTITQAGGRLPAGQVQRFVAMGDRDGWQLVVMYGQTEATARIAYLPPALATSHPSAIGVPVPGGSLRLDPVREVEGAGEDVGELVYEGPNVMLGYAESPADLARGRTTWELRTGDLGRRLDDGLYEVVGRRSRFLKLFGLRIDLDHVERLLRDAGVDARCTGDDMGLAVAVTSDGGADVDALLRRHVPIPTSAVAVIRVEALPRLPNGKVDDREIARLASEEAGTGGVGGTATGVAALFGRVLGVADVDDEDTFVGLGGDSLSYVEASIRLEDLLGVLPAGWQTLPVGTLETMRAPRRRLKRIETNVVLRAAAITMVVATHAGLIEQRGGAHLLLAIAGYNLARFQLGNGGSRNRSKVVLASAARIAVPAACWIALLVLLTDGYGLPNIALVNSHLGAMDFDERWRFWFVEVLVQGLIVVAALLALPPVRRFEGRRPFAFAVGVVVVALALRHGLVELLDARHRTVQPQTIFWVLALGWAAQRARSVRQRLVVSALVVLSMPGFFFDEAVREALIIGGVLLFTWVPRLAVPRPLDRLLAPVAGASLWIYLTHWHVHDWVSTRSSPLVGTVASLAVGTAVWWVGARLARRRRRAHQPGGAAASRSSSVRA